MNVRPAAGSASSAVATPLSCVVMGDESLNPQAVANDVRAWCAATPPAPPGRHGGIVVETACVQAPFFFFSNCLPSTASRTPQHQPLTTALILFSPMRPLSFVHADGFIDRLSHTPSLRIVLVAVDVAVLGSDTAVASLRAGSKSRPVGSDDVARYVALKRKALARADAQDGVSTLKRGGRMIASGDRFGSFAQAASGDYDSGASPSPPPRELVVYVDDDAARRSRLGQTGGLRRFDTLLQWCVRPLAASADLLVSSGDEGESWVGDWQRQVEAARTYFAQQRALFGAQGPVAAPAGSWVPVSLDVGLLPRAAVSPPSLPWSAASSPTNTTPGSPASVGLMRDFATMMPVTRSSDASSVQEADRRTQQRFAFWNPRTGDVSLSVPRDMVPADALALESLMAGGPTPPSPTQSASSSPSSSPTSAAAANAPPATARVCEPHIANKAITLAGRQRAELTAAAEKAAAASLQRAQHALAEHQARQRQLGAKLEALAKRRGEQQQRRGAVERDVKTAQQQLVAARLRLIDASSAADSPAGAALRYDPQREAALDRIAALESQEELSRWRDGVAAQWQRELDAYAASGGRQERSRVYLARFLENQSLRSRLQALEAANCELEEDVAALRRREWLPLNVRLRQLERRRGELLDEIQQVVRDDMCGGTTVSLTRFLDMLPRIARDADGGGGGVADILSRWHDHDPDADDDGGDGESSSDGSTSSSTTASDSASSASSRSDSGRRGAHRRPARLFHRSVQRIAVAVRAARRSLAHAASLTAAAPAEAARAWARSLGDDCAAISARGSGIVVGTQTAPQEQPWRVLSLRVDELASRQALVVGEAEARLHIAASAVSESVRRCQLARRIAAAKRRLMFGVTSGAATSGRESIAEQCPYVV